jgi:hypothetical protein
MLLDWNLVLQLKNTVALSDEIRKIMSENGFAKSCYSEILDYTIELFESHGLGNDYYGYHNIVHELEVTYVTLIAAQWETIQSNFTKEDLAYLFVAALFHDYDPQKKVDKPHEEDAVKFVINDEKLLILLRDARIDAKIVAALILRTTYPWKDELQKEAEKHIEECFSLSTITKDEPSKKEHYKKLGWFLSVADRIGGYALGDFFKAMAMH